LKVAHGAIYGFDVSTSTFMVSRDGGKRWERRSRVGLLDFAVSPESEDRIFATTGSGLITSPDGGRTWSPSAAPRLMFLSWTAVERLWGIDEAGTAHFSSDGGTTWSARGRLPAPPEAVLDTGTDLFAAVRDLGIYISGDGGASWQVHYSDTSGR
jgi:photosystem II stability/assembly factor-like uncharacterized protein